MLMVVAVSVGIVVLADSKWSAYKEVTSLRTNDFFSVAQPDLTTNAKIAVLNMPFDASGAAAAATNAAGIVGIVVAGIGPATNGSTATFTGMTNTSLTASRVKLTDANKAEVSAAASGAVPIDADGSASTGGQITNLLTGSAALNGAQIVGTVPAATTAVSATTATSLAGEGTIAMTNAANQTGLTFALGVLKFWATNVVVGSFTNANGGLGASNLTIISKASFGTNAGVFIDNSGNQTNSGNLSAGYVYSVNGITTYILNETGAHLYMGNNGYDINVAGNTFTFLNGNDNALQSIKALNGTFSGTGTFTNGVVSNSRRLLAPVSISVGGSPFNWTNSSAVGSGGTNNVYVFIDGSGVTGSVGLNGTTIFSGVTGADATVPLQPGEYVTCTFSVGTPIMFWKPF